MKKKFLSILLALGLLSTILTPALPVEAEGHSSGSPSGRQEVLPQGWQRLNAYTVTHKIRDEIINGQRIITYEALVNSVPATLDDGVTLIDTNWYLLSDASGQTWFETGVNTFKARVLQGRVSVEDGSGNLSVWNPTVSIGGKTFTGGTAKIADDPLIDNYQGNSLKWEYGSYSNGWWVFGNTAQVERYLRVIEGHISELWILPIDPKADVVISLNESAEIGFEGYITWLNAYDAEGSLLNVTKDTLGNYVIRASEFSDKVFPVTIDPTESFTSSAYDGFLRKFSSIYADARTAATGTVVNIDSIGVGQQFVSSLYWVFRGMLMFDTSSLPDNATISAAYLELDGYFDFSDTDFYITVQSGMPTYPRMPPVEGDYDYLNYSGNGGQFNTNGWTSGFNELYLNSTGLGWINKIGWTKFMLRSSRDIDGNAPSGYEYIQISSYERGEFYAPKLSITYSLPAVLPTVSSRNVTGLSETYATLVGYLDDDGNEPSAVSFQYGTTPSYGTSTGWMAGYTTGSLFGTTVYGLFPGTTYYYRARAMNSAGTAYGSQIIFTTPPYKPTSFTATSGDGTVALTWTKGSGADRTMIRRSTATYPTSPASGTQIYFDTGSSKDDNTAVNGTLYYYSAWSEKSGVYSTSYTSDYAIPAGLSAGEVTTGSIYGVGITDATLTLNVDDMGGSAHVHVRFQYYKGAGTWTDNETVESGEVGLGYYEQSISGLDADTLYHVRAKMVNDTGTAYGSDVTFTTGAVSAPTMNTQSETGVQLFAVTLNGAVTADGGVSVTAWFEWGLTTSYGNSSPTTSGLITSDIFYYGLGGLEPNTTYNYRAVGQNSAGIGYGGNEEFTTSTPTAPTVRTDAASSIGANQATFNATVLTDGNVEVEVRFQYGLTDSYGTDTAWVGGYFAPQTFEKLISGLTVGETYHFRAQARNAGGTGSGGDAEFTTVFGAPENFRGKAISSVTINLNWEKSGDQTHIRYKATGFPIDREDGDFVYNGPDESSSVSGLSAGITYYFRAWSWREGDVWADDYAEDVATTQATVAMGEGEPGEVAGLPGEPSGFFQEPSGAAFEDTPLFEVVESAADAYEMPSGGLWLLLAFAISMGLAVATYIGTGAMVGGMGVKGRAMASTIVSIVALGVFSWLGLISLWILLPYILVTLGVNFAIGRLEVGG